MNFILLKIHFVQQPYVMVENVLQHRMHLFAHVRLEKLVIVAK